MARFEEISVRGRGIIYNEKWLEEAMKPYLTLRYTMDESQKRKRKTGFVIYSIDEEIRNYPFIPYNFSRVTDARFIIKLLLLKIPSMKNLYIKKVRKKTDLEAKEKIKITKYEVLRLDDKARIHIWENFRV